MSTPRRGDVFWVDIPKAHTVGSEQTKRRPFVVVSRTGLNLAIPVVVGVPLSSRTSKQNRAHRIFVPKKEIVSDDPKQWTPIDSIALTEQVRVLAVERLDQPRAGRVTPTAMAAIEVGLAYVLDMP